ncbi:UNVERIFIED_CONTAM: hypothetical protein O8I53_07610 [Campylobacter lari]
MEYQEFEQNLKLSLLTNSAKKLIYKLIEAPFRFDSLMHPFNFKTKLEQSFIRSQENTYYKFIKDYATMLFNSYEYKSINPLIKITRPLGENKEKFEVIKYNFTHAFEKQDENTIYYI